MNPCIKFLSAQNNSAVSVSLIEYWLIDSPNERLLLDEGEDKYKEGREMLIRETVAQ